MIDMNTTRLKQARRMFFHDLVEPKTARHNARMWARSVRFLGAKWRAVNHSPRLDKPYGA